MEWNMVQGYRTWPRLSHNLANPHESLKLELPGAWEPPDGLGPLPVGTLAQGSTTRGIGAPALDPSQPTLERISTDCTNRLSVVEFLPKI